MDNFMGSCSSSLSSFSHLVTSPRGSLYIPSYIVHQTAGHSTQSYDLRVRWRPNISQHLLCRLRSKISKLPWPTGSFISVVISKSWYQMNQWVGCKLPKQARWSGDLQDPLAGSMWLFRVSGRSKGFARGDAWCGSPPWGLTRAQLSAGESIFTRHLAGNDRHGWKMRYSL